MTIECPKCQHKNPDETAFCGKCGTRLKEEGADKTKTVETPTEDFSTGSIFAGRYRIIEKLGKGGMGKVYRVLDSKLNEEIALKLIKSDISSDKKTIDRFKNELKLARKIRQKNVGSMYELLEEKGTHYITMEYISGQDLKGLIRQTGQLTVRKSLSIAQQICEGLSEAHSLGVVHRDLKPNNIMIDRSGNVRIMDFGIARAVKGKSITGTGIMIGTPEYMSPEQVEGKDVDHRADIYSLGILLYEMLTARIPFEGDTPFTIGVKQKSDTPQNPKELNIRIPDELSSVILKCLEKDKSRRFQNAEELRSELSRIQKEILDGETPLLVEKRRKTKKISRKRHVYLGLATVVFIIIAGAVLIVVKGRGKAIDTIAVLPFGYSGDDLNMEYLSDGMTERIINNLSQLQGLKKVIAFSSVMSFKGKNVNPADIGQELDVDAVLISRMLQRDDELTIRVELVGIQDNSRIWGDQYKLNVTEIFDAQETISNAITKNLRLNIAGDEKERLTKRYTDNPEAYKAYLKGRFYWNKRTKDGLMKSLDYFDEAIQGDPVYALAYAGLADSYALLARYSYLAPDDAMPKGKAAAQKALEMDADLSEAHTSLAFIETYYDFDWLEAEREFKKSIELNPNYATAHHWYALLLSLKGEYDRAIEEIKRAQELDPLSIIINTNVGWIYYFARQYENAIDQFQKTLEMDPNFAVTHLRLGRTHIQKGSFEKGIEELQRAVSLSPESTEILAALGHAYAVSGKNEEARKIIEDLNRLERNKYVSSYDKALIHIGLEEQEKAFEYLNKAFLEKSSYLTYIKVDPKVDSLRSEPRFKELLGKMNLQ